MNWMMKKRKNKGEKLMKKFAWMFLAVIALAGCQKEAKPEEEKEQIPQPSQGPYTLTLQASKGADTKALSLDESTLNAYWKDGEQVAVYLGGTYLGMLTADADDSDNHKATLSGELTTVENVQQGSELTLLFPRADWDYTGQNGTAPSETGSLATKYDYATASVTVASLDAINKTITVTSGANFQNQQSMYRFGFKAGGNTLAVNGFSVGSANNALVRSRSWSGGDWTENCGTIDVNTSGAQAVSYVSLRNTLVGTPTQQQIADKSTIDTYYFYVIGSDNALYTGQKKIPAQVMDVQGKFISAQNISVTKSDLSKSGTTTVVW